MSLLVTGPVLNRIAVSSALPFQLYGPSFPASSLESLGLPRSLYLLSEAMEMLQPPALVDGLRVTGRVTL